MVFVLQFRLGGFGPAPDGFCFVADERPRGVGVVPAREGQGEEEEARRREGVGQTYSCGPSSSTPAMRSATPNGRL